MATVPEGIVDPSHASALVRAVCGEGIRQWERCRQVASGGDENLLLLQTHHHIIELLDAVAVLIGAGAVEPAKLQLRAALEALLTLEYLVQGDTRRRAYGWLVAADVLDRIRTYDRFDRATQEGKAFFKLVEREQHRMPALEIARSQRTTLQRMLETDSRWTEAYREYLRVKKVLGKRRPEWYELFDGPAGPGLRNLAVHLGLGSYYEIVYRLWSRRMHGTDVVQRVKPGTEPGSLAVEPVRYAADINLVLNYSVSFGLWSIRSVVGYYSPVDLAALRDWYLREIRPNWPAAAKPVPEL